MGVIKSHRHFTPCMHASQLVFRLPPGRSLELEVRLILCGKFPSRRKRFTRKR
jgi:hypothetical protein